MSEIYQWQTIGHAGSKRILDKQLISGRLAHAYVFLGSDSVGKRTLAEEFANRLLGGLGDNLVRLDFKDAGMVDLRQVLARLALRPAAGQQQVAIFDSAEEMTSATSNALLKTLEEPTPGTVLILIASRASLPHTVLSRCQVLHFGRLSVSEILAVIKQQGLVPLPDLALAASGRISQYLSAIGEGPANEIVAWKRDWQALLETPVFGRLGMAQLWAGEENNDLIRRIEFWLGSVLSGKGSVARMAIQAQVLLEAWNRLSKNANKKMVLEYICLSL
jgi:hypothetical protein